MTSQTFIFKPIVSIISPSYHKNKKLLHYDLISMLSNLYKKQATLQLCLDLSKARVICLMDCIH